MGWKLKSSPFVPLRKSHFCKSVKIKSSQFSRVDGVETRGYGDELEVKLNAAMQTMQFLVAALIFIYSKV